MRFRLAVALLLAGCAAAPPPGVHAVDALLLGEQHDAAAHPGLQAGTLRELAARDRLGALALEMAERGTSTAGLERDAGEQQVRAALRWNTQAWPWERYGPVVMEAVRAGVPVLGANLPRDQLREAMEDAALDRVLPQAALRAQQEAIRSGHCDLLPQHQLRPMARIQIARDRAMAQAVMSALAPGKTVVLVAGAGHVQPQLGVPMHLPATLTVQPVLLPPEDTGRDYCAELRQRMRRPPA